MKSKQTLKKVLIAFVIVLLIILLFAFVDFLIHLLKAEYSVPSYYFRNKIIFGTIIGLVAYYFVRNQKLFLKSLIFSLAVSILLQIRYFIEGYSLSFVLLFLGIHFIILLPISFLLLRFIKE